MQERYNCADQLPHVLCENFPDVFEQSWSALARAPATPSTPPGTACSLWIACAGGVAGIMAALRRQCRRCGRKR